MHIAAEKGHQPILAHLLAASPGALDRLADLQGNNPLHVAVNSGCVPAVELLLSTGMLVDTPGISHCLNLS